jgi:YidC/Oxa1 family membrane protein insertase
MNDQKNTILALVLSALVLFAWQYFVGMPQMEKQKQIAQQQALEHVQPGPGAATQPGALPGIPGQAATMLPQALSREEALARSRRLAIETPSLHGSIALKGGRIDDLSLTRYHETVDPSSPPIILLSPSGGPEPYYADFGWVGAEGASAKLPGPDTEWQQESSGALGVDHPVTLVYDNGEGLIFRRTISVDDKYLFTIKDAVANKGAAPVTLYPYGLAARHGTPPTLGYSVLHEGMIGYLGADRQQEVTYKSIEDKKSIEFNVTDAWLGFTDKYWGVVLLPNPDAHVRADFKAWPTETPKRYQADYRLDAQTIQPGGTGGAETRLFAGAKEVATLDDYEKQLSLNHFDLLIDWGWFYFITKPLFRVIDLLFHVFHNFGVAILLVTVAIKIVFFPLANKSYASMAKMKAAQPQMLALRERFADDKMKQQQALMELYKKEKINPVAGCLPMLIQVPVFFSLYKVLLITIEMRHAPFFGWIRDLSAPDPTNLFNLFGLIPWDPTHLPLVGHFLVLGLWPLIMGVTMWFQMKLNPTPPDPTQKMIFDWMPVIFTFMLANFPAGLVIYWAWNNTLSVIQQSVIMHRHGAKIELWDNLKGQVGVPRALWERLKLQFAKFAKR